MVPPTIFSVKTFNRIGELMNKYLTLTLLLFLLCLPQVTLAEDYLNKVLQPEQVKADLTQWMAFLDKTHPQLAYTVADVDNFYNDVEKFKNSVDKPMSVLELWRQVSIFNSILNDGHTVIKLPNLKNIVNDYIKGGGGLFPFQVLFEEDKLFIKSKLNGQTSEYRKSAITHINGKPINDFIAPLLKRTNGDSESFRRALLQRRFAQYTWLYYGRIDAFTLTLDKYGQVQTKTFEASTDGLAPKPSFSEQFKLELLDSENALLTINTFYWGAEYKEVIQFLHESFATLAKQNIRHLMIDIRENGGGDDGIWIDGILPYIADKTWRTGSNFKAKVIEGRADEGETVGDVVTGENRFREVDNNVKKFEGDVSVLISNFTYSSSILFANVIQDHQFGVLVGEATGGKSGQTGGTQAAALKHSKLRVISPFFYLERPKGGDNHNPVKPDIAIKYDKTIPKQLVYKLINRRSLMPTKAG